ncbi:hypothetical protein Bca4012_050677 [Brassica carinata]
MPRPLHSNVAKENVSLFFHESVLQFTSSRFFNLTQGTVSANRQLRFRERLSKGSLYTLTGFDIVRTSLEKVTTSARPIPTELFRFMAYSLILEFEKTGKQLPDVIGELNAIRSTITDRLPGAQRVMLTLRLRSGENICVSRLFLNGTSSTHLYFDSETAAGKEVFDMSIGPSSSRSAFIPFPDCVPQPVVTPPV